MNSPAPLPLHPNNVRFHYRLPFGAEYLGNGRTSFRLWAPLAKTASVLIDGQRKVPMTPADEGWFEVETDCEARSQYRYELMSQTDGEISVPDPASRGQAGDVHADSMVIDASAYEWQTVDWRGRPWHETVLYELHVGALGGFAGVLQRLPELAELGITAIELMPVAEFPGAYNWGYDGVLPYAPDASYGTPEQLKQLIDTAHGLGMMVFLDVVYNHFGPDGNYLNSYAAPFFRNDTTTPWGETIDFRRPEVADFFAQNALYWLQEYRFDGLRLDAVHAISEQGWLRDLARKVRRAIEQEDADIGLSRRHVHLVLEHDGNAASLLDGGAGKPGEGDKYDAQWNDDGHHVLHVLLTGETGGYYSDYAVQPAEKLARCLREGFVYQGEPSPYRDNEVRGEPSVELPPTSFVLFLQNHDQIGNRAQGERLTALAHPDALRAAQALLLLSPQIPMLFMGEEYGAPQPFYYFTSHADEKLADAVRNGRRKEFSRFPEFSDPQALDALPDPNSFSTFMASIPEPVSPEEDKSAGQWMGWCYRLLQIRREAITPYLPGAVALDAQAIGLKAVYARWRLNNGTVLNITVNLGEQPLRESLETLVTPAGADVLFDSGGVLDALASGTLPGHSILVIREAAR
ncbi:malto-oligosyltrehalose trehalohydrolase [Herbaspirillum sp. NPDC101397]|uniref:malto-oligosyltrehalose trehalohydrolase n=1 Tax=Herbaspirillum sp. NPDC101397 TaxID=3364006 RepID=UPI00383AF5D9